MNIPPRRLAALFLLLLPIAASAAPQWIWLGPSSPANEKVVFLHTFNADADIRSAALEFTCDNRARVLVNDLEAGRLDDWGSPVRAHIKALLKPGVNTLRVEAANDGGSAGLLLRLTITYRNKRVETVETGANWTAAPAEAATFKPVHVIGPAGMPPWGDVFARSAPAPEVRVADGFRVDRIHLVPKGEQGSWVAMTVDPRGRLVCADQHGALFRLTPPPAGSEDPAEVDKLATQVAGAHGLLYAFDSLYAVVNEKGRTGLWRLRDTNNDDAYDAEEFLLSLPGGGEHGPHSVLVAPDGKNLLLVSGNHTRLPVGMVRARAAMNSWQEDQLVPRMWDANGHARGILAPGGHIVLVSPDGASPELWSAGYRNTFDAAVSSAGEIFTYDSDMEWDMGAPWYRPTRFCHATSGSEFGWRSGSGKWPDYYPDSLPALLDIGPGSPTGMTFGTGAKFPARYQRALFGCDWTFGTLYALHLTPAGASYTAVKEEFVTGRPLPLTDLLIHPGDGAMYFAVGGRGTQSAVYRVTYTGDESTAPAAPETLTAEATLRREIETLHRDDAGPGALDQAWPHLDHPDRFVRFAARVAIERQPVELWSARALAEGRPRARLEALLALARMGRPEHLQPWLEVMGHIAWESLDPAQKLALVRLYGVGICRLGRPEVAAAAALASTFEARYPSGDRHLDRELCRLLVALGSAPVVEKSLRLMSTATADEGALGDVELLSRNEGYAGAIRRLNTHRPNQQQIALAFCLQYADAGWTPALREQFFAWFQSASAFQGGNSLKGFIGNIRKAALERVPAGERGLLDALSSARPATGITYTPPQGPGREQTVDSVLKAVEGKLEGRDLARGRNLFGATACIACHAFAGEGGGVGPDLTGVAGRYTLRDLIENIVEPSRIISDQYGSEKITTREGGVLIGRAGAPVDGRVQVAMNPFAPTDTITIQAADIQTREPHPVSLMPPGLINGLNDDELRDLLAYLLSGGKL
jgi:putative heme-binding domain-containing protein